MPTLVARTGTCARPEFWRSQRSRAHKPPPQPDASPDADPQMHVWSVRCGRCARAKTSGIKVQPRHPSGCLVLNPRDPGRAVWQYPREVGLPLLLTLGWPVQGGFLRSPSPGIPDPRPRCVKYQPPGSHQRSAGVNCTAAAQWPVSKALVVFFV